MNRKTDTVPLVTHDGALYPERREEKKKPVFKIMGFILVVVLFFFGVSSLLYWLVFAPTDFVGGVASSNKYATDVGNQVLAAGGNAIDAMVAMQAMLTLTEPSGSGIGGGCFITYYSSLENKVVSIDGREEAPRGSTNQRPTTYTGGHVVGVPGTVAALARALRDYGTWSLEKCFQPAIKLAREGYIIDSYGALAIETYKDKLGKFSATRDIYFDENGQPKQAGSVIKNPDLANTFERLITEGWEDFYTGEIAQSIVSTVQNDVYYPGKLSLQDMEEYRAVERKPLKTTFRDLEIFGMNMPSSGSTTLFAALNFLENITFSDVNATSIQLVMSALNLAYADRAEYTADADFVDVPVDGLIDKTYAAIRSKLLNNFMGINSVSPGTPPGIENRTDIGSKQEESLHTTHFSIVDRNKNVVSITSTIEATFGNGMVVPGRGFLLNNELTDFSESGINAITGERRYRRTALSPDNSTIGGKRPRSTMTPIIVFKNKQPYFTVGSPGGSNIAGTVTNGFLNIAAYGMAAQEAVDAPRYISRNEGTWKIEKELLNNTVILEDLQKMGINSTNIVAVSEYEAGAMAIIKINSDGSLDIGEDSRRKK